MSARFITRATVFVAIIGAALAAWTAAASACGGFFCQNQPVDQTGERIVFTANPDGTITTLVEIQYFGEAEDFSWILPIPEAIDADDLDVPEGGADVFTELHQLTDVQIIAPEFPDCADDVMATADVAMEDSMESGVEIFASGEVGPFGFDVVGSEDPDALVQWLRDNRYQVTADMEPLIDIYVDQEMAFVAMRLLDGQDSDSIEPIEITYGGTEPMIPLRLTAVAAQPNMPIWVWIFGEHRAMSTNFTNMEIATEEISFFPFGGNDYTFLVQQRANALDGHAFITEYAQPVDAGTFEHPWLQAQAETAPYLTRMNTFIDPEEMTADPMFGFDADLPDVSNIRDASDLAGLYSCERDESGGVLDAIFGAESDAIDPRDGGELVVAFTPEDGGDNGEVNLTGDGDAPDGDATSVATPASDAEPEGSRGALFAVLGILALVGLAITARIRRSDA